MNVLYIALAYDEIKKYNNITNKKKKIVYYLTLFCYFYKII